VIAIVNFEEKEAPTPYSPTLMQDNTKFIIVNIITIIEAQIRNTSTKSN